MPARDIHSPALLRQLLAYNPETGRLTWKPRDLSWFEHCKQPETRWLSWRSRHENKFADEHITHAGYRATSVFAIRAQSHRIAWAVHFGAWPSTTIDHIDGDRANNVMANLRLATSEVNAKNKRFSEKNTSGYTGVSVCSATKAWKAQIGSGGKVYNLGRYARIEDAIAARKAAEIKFDFHPNHGRK